MFACGLAGCEAGPEPMPLAALCGALAPTQVLATSATQVLTDPPLRLGERALYTTRAPMEPPVEPQVGVAFGPPELASVGACGESPRQLGGLAAPELRERWPGVALACDPERGQIVAVDPASADPPRPLYNDCGVAWSAHGRISVAADGPLKDWLVLHPDPAGLADGPAEPVPLFGPVRPRVQTLAVRDELVFALAGDGSVVSIDLRTRRPTIEQTGVRSFYVSADGRYLLWQGLEVTGGPDDLVIRGPVVLADRETGLGVGLGETGLGYSADSLLWADQGRMVLTVGTYQQIYALPDLAVVDLPEGLVVDLLGPVDEQRWLLRGQWDQSTHVIDMTTGVTSTLFAGSTVMIGRDAEVAWLIEMSPCCEEGADTDEGAVWWTPLDGSGPVPIGARASRYFARVGTQLVTVVDIDADHLGSLLRIDLASGAEQVVDSRVFADSLQADPATGVVSYSRSDGERSGVWQLALPRTQ